VENLNLELPVNKLSFGNCSINILLELFKMKKNPTIFLVGGQADFSTFSKNVPEGFIDWFKDACSASQSRHSRKNPTFKLWHLNGSMNSTSNDQYLFTFYELDSPTPTEVNIVKNQKHVFFSSHLAVDSFARSGCSNASYCPLGFDSGSFFKKEVKKNDNKICFGLAGKLEKRKQHHKVIRNWAKKYGNNPKYLLNCAITNPFLSKEQNQKSIEAILQGKSYFNINFLDFMENNSIYNNYLNYNDIIIGMSSAEGWGLPEFQSVGIGKHSVILNAHSYSEWATNENSTLVEPSGKIPCYDGIFFNQGQEFNQGSYFDWSDEEFISACEKAEQRFNLNSNNTAGEKLVKEFTWEKTTKIILEKMGA
jgi:hypothetical protein